MSIEEQKRELIVEKNKQTEREREMNLWERKIEEREKFLEEREEMIKQKEEILYNIHSDIKYIRSSIYNSLEIFDNSVSDDLHHMKALLDQLMGY